MKHGGVVSSLGCFETLVAHWRGAASEMDGDHTHPYNTCETASVLRAVACELEDAIQSHHLEELTVQEAAIESGYSEWHLRDLVRSGGIPAQRNGSRWLIQRRHLPQRPGVPRG